jgi:hypothetical protein
LVSSPSAPAATVQPRVAAFVTAGIAVVGLGVGITFGVLALDTQTSFNQHPTVAGANMGNQEAVIADVGFGAAVIAGVTSVLLFVKKDAPPGSVPVKESAVSFTVSPMVSEHGGGAGAILRF